MENIQPAASKFVLAKRSFEAALDCIRLQPTPYEGLYQAYVESLSKIDVKSDLPTRLKPQFSEWLRVTAPRAGLGETYASALMKRVRTMTQREINDQIGKLVQMSKELNEC